MQQVALVIHARGSSGLVASHCLAKEKQTGVVRQMGALDLHGAVADLA
jgi:hypothetical protein